MKPKLILFNQNRRFSVLGVKRKQSSETVSLAALKRSPFGKFMRIRPIRVVLLSTSEIESLGYYPTETIHFDEFTSPDQWTKTRSMGFYDASKDIVVINHDIVKTFPELLDPIEQHELLHAFSYKKVGEGEDFMFGFCFYKVEHSKVVGVRNEALNEAVTEYLRVKAGGMPRWGTYPGIKQAADLFVQKVGEEWLYQAYFCGDEKELAQRINALYGEGAFCTLSRLFDNLPDESGIFMIEKRGQQLLDFLRHGFEAFLMEEWSYSENTRARAPRELLREQVPNELGQILARNRVRFFTNLSEDELRGFFRKMPDRQNYRNDNEYNNFRLIEKGIKHEMGLLKKGQCLCLFVIYRDQTGFGGVSVKLQAISNSEGLDRARLVPDNFCNLFWIKM